MLASSPDWWTEKNGVPHDPASALAPPGRPALGYLLWTASRLCADGQISSTELDRTARTVESTFFASLRSRAAKTNEIEQHLAASAEYLLDRSVKDAVKVLATGSPTPTFCGILDGPPEVTRSSSMSCARLSAH